MGDAAFGWAVVGPGAIAHRFAEAATRLPAARVVAVVGRDATRATQFANRWQSDATIATQLEDALRDTRIEGVYIATPHPFHAEPALTALAAGKAVLCEKPLTLNEATARQLIRASERHRAFLMEAVWTRFLPAYQQAKQWLNDGVIGGVRAVQSSFCFHTPFNPQSRLFARHLGGGAVLDIGVYCLSLTQWALRQSAGNPPLTTINVTGALTSTAVDQRVAALLTFDGGITAQFVCATDMHSDNAFRIFGERGAIVFPYRFWEATTVELHRPGEDVIRRTHPFAINGFEGQIEETMRCARDGRIESPVVAHADTLEVMAWMDMIRHQLGVRYEGE